MIRDISHKTLGLSFFLLTIGTAGGWAMVSSIAGDKAAFNFLIIGSLIQIIIFLSQLSVFLYMRKRIVFQLIFLAMCGLSLAWFMFSLVSPILWLNAVDNKIKSLILMVLLILIASNVAESFRVFEKRWSGLEASVRIKRLGVIGDTINWDKLINSMRLEADMYIPGFSRGFSLVISILMLVFMVLGFNLRHVYPVFSAFAWGIPSALIVAYLFQLIGLNLAQASKVRMLEKEYKVIFRQKM